MNLRNLEKKDAPLMLEWMHDESVVKWLQASFSEKTIDDCLRFIEISQNSDSDLNMAIVDDNDVYMGTTSLKNIDHENKTAEFAITIRSQAMGQGFSKYGMNEIMKYGFEKCGLNAIYWCVSYENERAVRFYEKGNWKRTTNVPNSISERYDNELLKKLIWYVTEK